MQQSTSLGTVGMKTNLTYDKKYYDNFLTGLDIFVHLLFQHNKLTLQGFFWCFFVFFRYYSLSV